MPRSRSGCSRHDPGRKQPGRHRRTCSCYLSLWFTVGRDHDLDDGEWKMVGGAANPDSILISSEPLTVDTSTWLEVPEYSALYASFVDDRLCLRHQIGGGGCFSDRAQ